MQALLATSSLQKAAKLLEDAAAGKYQAKTASAEQLEADLSHTLQVKAQLERLIIPVDSSGNGLIAVA